MAVALVGPAPLTLGRPRAPATPGLLYIFSHDAGNETYVGLKRVDGPGCRPVLLRPDVLEVVTSADGRNLLLMGPDTVLMRADGSRVALERFRDEADLALSPDAQRVADTVWKRGIAVRRIRGPRRPHRITHGQDAEPTWSTGGRIAFARAESDGRSALFVVNADGSHLKRLTARHRDHAPQWSPSGDRIAFVRDGHVDVADADGRNVRPLTRGARDGDPVWSPDGRLIAFTHATASSRRGGLYVTKASGGKSWRLVTDDVSAVAWAVPPLTTRRVTNC